MARIQGITRMGGMNYEWHWYTEINGAKGPKHSSTPSAVNQVLFVPFGPLV